MSVLDNLSIYSERKGALEELGVYVKSIYNVLRKLKRSSSVVTDILKALISLPSVNAVSSQHSLLVHSFLCFRNAGCAYKVCICFSQSYGLVLKSLTWIRASMGMYFPCFIRRVEFTAVTLMEQ